MPPEDARFRPVQPEGDRLVHGVMVTVASVWPGVTPTAAGGGSGVLQTLGAVFGSMVNDGAPVAKYASRSFLIEAPSQVTMLGGGTSVEA